MATDLEPVQEALKELAKLGVCKRERKIDSAQQSVVRLGDGREVINLCANNYLGLANHPEVVDAAHRALDRWGYGMASVRFICGTQTCHKQLEQELSDFLGFEDTILYASCFDANAGLFETLLSAEDAVISDSLNHASIIDGVRLCKAQRYRYASNDMADLREKLMQATSQGARQKLITTDGVFSMDGSVAKLDQICELADKFNAMVHFDDCHATGFWGPTGKGTHEYRGVMNRIDITTGTLGKALGGGSGGYISSRSEIVELLRQRSRPYLFSNTLPPMMVAGARKALELVKRSADLRDTLNSNTQLFREEMAKKDFRILPGDHPIVPIMLGDARLASTMAERLLEHGIYVVGFSYPVVPKGEARIRVQISAAHSADQIHFAVDQFAKVNSDLHAE